MLTKLTITTIHNQITYAVESVRYYVSYANDSIFIALVVKNKVDLQLHIKFIATLSMTNCFKKKKKKLINFDVFINANEN